MKNPSFLEGVAQQIKEELEMGNTPLVIAPSKRLYLYLKKELVQKLDVSKPWMLPEVYSPNEFFQKISGKTLMDPLEALVQLFQIAQRIIPEESETFGDFFSWGKTLLKDFGEIDQYLVDSKKIYTNLTSIQNIENWSFNSSKPLSEGQQQFLRKLQLVERIYSEFQVSQRSSDMFISGSLNRWLCEEQWEWPEKWAKKKVMVLGLNAITPAEQGVFKAVKQHAEVEFHWDIDPYFLKEQKWDVGLFIHENVQKWGGTVWPKESAILSPKTITHHSFANPFALHTFAGNAIREKSGRKKAVVLMDESQMTKVLGGVGGDSALNITMGIPLKNTPYFSLIQSALESCIQFQRYGFFAVEQLKSWMTQPGMNLHFDLDMQSHSKWMSDGYFRPVLESELGELPPFLQMITKLGNARDARSFLHAFMESFQFSEEILLGLDPLRRESYLEFVRFCGNMTEQLETYQLEVNLRHLKVIMGLFIKDHEINLIGEPLTDHQILGLLETRGLDFEASYLCGANESLLPGSSHSDSLIPYDLKMHFGLPGKREKEAVFAYYFFQLVCHSRELHICSTQASAEDQSEEVSRYVRQLSYMCGQDAIPWGFKESENYALPEKPGAEVQLPRSKQIDLLFQEFLSRGVSASAINLALDNPLHFVIKHLFQVYEQDEVSSDFQNREFGTIAHRILELTFEPFYGKVMEAQAIPKLIQGLEDKRDIAYAEYFNRPFSTLIGKKRLNGELMVELIAGVLKREQEFLEHIEAQGERLTMIECERKIERAITLPNGKSIVLKGTIDRIDRIGKDTIRIVDYKTGRGTIRGLDKVLNNEELFNTPNDLKIPRQLVLYALLMEEEPELRSSEVSLELGCCSFRENRGKVVTNSVDKEALIEFTKEGLDQWIAYFGGLESFTEGETSYSLFTA